MAQPTPLANRIAGLLCAACGVLPLLAAFDIGPLHPSDIHGPPWLGIAAGGVFVCAGAAVALGGELPLLRTLFALLTMIGLAALGNWVAFGAGARSCGGTFSLAGLFGAGHLDGLACRLPFGFGALLLDTLLGYGAASLLQKALGGPPRLAWLVKAAGALVLLVLSPLLLLLLLAAIGRSGYDVLKSRLATGRWPRNEAFIRRREAARRERR